MEEGQSSAASKQPMQRLVESTLYKEDVLTLGHTTVWGSWYDATEKRWGYACCKGLQRDQPCPVTPPLSEAARKAAAADGEDSGIEVTSPDSEGQTEFDFWDFSNPPAELLPFEKLQPATYIEHWTHYLFGAWQREKESGFKGFGPIELAAFKDSIKDCQVAMTPLLWRLKKGVSLDRGEKKHEGRSRETRTSMEGKFVKEKSVLGQLMKMATSATNQDYQAAHAAYMHLTFGNKMWNLTHVAHVAACTMKGAREYRRNRDSLNTYDMDPVSQKYMHGMKKLCHLAQCLRPNTEDPSRNVMM